MTEILGPGTRVKVIGDVWGDSWLLGKTGSIVETIYRADYSIQYRVKLDEATDYGRKFLFEQSEIEPIKEAGVEES